jgi:hypothetical protein
MYQAHLARTANVASALNGLSRVPWSVSTGLARPARTAEAPGVSHPFEETVRVELEASGNRLQMNGDTKRLAVRIGKEAQVARGNIGKRPDVTLAWNPHTLSQLPRLEMPRGNRARARRCRRSAALTARSEHHTAVLLDLCPMGRSPTQSSGSPQRWRVAGHRSLRSRRSLISCRGHYPGNQVRLSDLNDKAYGPEQPFVDADVCGPKAAAKCR